MTTFRDYLKVSYLIAACAPALAVGATPVRDDVESAGITGPVSPEILPSPENLPSVYDNDLLFYVANNSTDELSETPVNPSGRWTAETSTGHESVTTPAFLEPVAAPMVYMVFVGNDGQNELKIASSSDGIHWSSSYAIGCVRSKFAPALSVVYSTDQTYQLAVAYVTDDGSNDLYVIETQLLNPLSPASAIQWESPVQLEGQKSKTAPAMTAFVDASDGVELVLAYVADNASDELLITTSTDGINWPTHTTVKGPQDETPQQSPLAPALIDYYSGNESTLLLGYVASNGSNDLLVTTSTDAVSWTKSNAVQGQQSSEAPALQVGLDQRSVIMAYVANNNSHDLLVTTSSDGIHWNASSPVGTQTSKAAPALGALF